MDRFPLTISTVEEVCHDFHGRRAGLVQALTDDAETVYLLCDPCEENLCLYGTPDGSWDIASPQDTVPPKLPDPAMGINSIRDEMPKMRWISLVAIYSDSWLISVAFHLGGLCGFNQRNRDELFRMINSSPSVHETVQRNLATDLEKMAKNNGGEKSSTTEIGSREIKMIMRIIENIRAEERKALLPDDDNAVRKGKEISIQTDEHAGASEPSGRKRDENGGASGSSSRTTNEKERAKGDEERNVKPAQMDEKARAEGGGNEQSCDACRDNPISDDFWVCCSICLTMFHGKCINFTPERAMRLDYSCPPCYAKKKARGKSHC